MQELNCRYYDEIILKDEKILTVYLMLQSGQRVCYDNFYEIFESSKRTFNRVIATIRRVLENIESDDVIVYCNATYSYRLVKVY